MKKIMRSLSMILAVLMMAGMMSACGGESSSNNDAKTETTQQVTTVATEQETTAVSTDETKADDADTDTKEDTNEDTNADSNQVSSKITEEEAIELVKEEVGEGFSYIPDDEIEEKDGKEYYVIYVKHLVNDSTLSTLTTYYVRTDGLEVFDKYEDSVADDTDTDENTDQAPTVITRDNAVMIVRKYIGPGFSLIPADELREKDGEQYYVVYVKQLVNDSTLTTLTTYLVKLDGSEVIEDV